MKVSRVVTGLLAMAALSSMLSVSARNPARLTNVSFVIPATCTPGVGAARCVSQNGTLGILVTQGDNGSVPDGNLAGWEVFTTFPGVSPGTITPSAITSAPSGTYSFTISGLTGSGNMVQIFSTDTDNGANGIPYPISNGLVSVPSPPVSDPGSSVAAIGFWVLNNGSPVIAPYFVSNFKVNNSPILIDTTHTDNNSVETNFSWCNNF